MKYKSTLLIAAVIVLGCDLEHADDSVEDLNSKETIAIVIHEPGTLQLLTESKLNSDVCNISISGKLNGTDLKFLRSILGYEYSDLRVHGLKVSKIDLSDCALVKGGSAYYTDDSGKEYTINADGELPPYAFAYCDKLSSIILNEEIRIISHGAFNGCVALSHVSCGELDAIEGYAFHSCKKLEGFDFSKVKYYIGRAAFFNNYALKDKVVLSPTMRFIGAGAFFNTQITEVVINSDIDIEDGIDFDAVFFGEFAACSSLSSVTIADGCTKLDLRFKGCNKLREVSLPAGLLSIGEISTAENPIVKGGHFSGCKSLESIDFPETIQVICNYCFNNTGLKEVSLPPSVRNLGTNVFSKCENLEDVVILSKDLILDNADFSNCPSLKTINLPDNLTYLPDSLFKNCSSLEKIVIPSKVDTLFSEAFYGCHMLQQVDLPDNLKGIRESAFQYCRSLQNLNIPNSVVDLRTSAFASSALTSIELPKFLESIPYACFDGCMRLESVQIKENVQAIGNYAFRSCTGMKAMQVDAIVPPAVESASFENVPKSIQLIVPESSLNLYENDVYWSYFFN